MPGFLEALSDFSFFLEIWGVRVSVDRLRDEHLDATDRIVASSELIADRLNVLTQALERQTTAIETGFDSVVAQLDFEAAVLTRILETLYRPTEVRARELRQLGERALRGSLYDDAWIDFNQAIEINRYDYTSQFALAVIASEHRAEPEEAWKRCELTLQYAQLRDTEKDRHISEYFASRALLLMGDILEAAGLEGDALQYHAAACEMSPDYAECLLRCARLLGTMNNIPLSTKYARAAICVEYTTADDISADPHLSPAVPDALAEESRLAQLLAAHSSAIKEATSSLVDVLRQDGRLNIDKASARLVRMKTRHGLSTEWMRSQSLRDTATSVAGFWAVVTTARLIVRDLSGPIHEHAVKQRMAVGERLLTAESDLGREIRAAKEERGRLGGPGYFFAIIGRLTMMFAGVLAFAGVSWLLDDNTTTDQGVFVGYFSAVLVIFLVGLFLVTRVAGSRQARQKIRERNAQAAYSSAIDTVHDLQAWLDNANTVWGHLTRLLADTPQDLLDREDITCSIAIVDAKPQRDGYNEVTWAEHIQTAVRAELGDHLTPSIAHIKDVLRTPPGILLNNIQISRAESLVSYFTDELGMSVGLKRRFIGDLTAPTLLT